LSSLALIMAAGQVLGGLILFIYGMNVMSQGLRRAAGANLRRLLFHLTRHRAAGALVGTVLGFLVHSSAATLMLVGFINAGLMRLSDSIPVVLGANVGTTFSMQLVSFRLDEYSFIAIALGGFCQLAARRDTLRRLGRALFGFGLLFLGMQTMSAGVLPLRELGILDEVLRHTHSDTPLGLITGLLAAALLTGIVQSSGATVGVLFALSAAGVFTEFGQVFPLLLGAHIGTCVTALLGSIGTDIEARRAALAHLLFNVLGAVIAIAMMSFYRWVVPLTAGDLVRQIANAHTLIHLVNALVALPLVGPFERLIVWLSPSRQAPREKSHLEERYFDTPEMAILAAMRETQRMARLTRHGLEAAVESFVGGAATSFTRVARTEAALDELKEAIERYLFQLAARRLSKRQSILVQHLMQTASDLERIGDHATTFTEISRERLERGIGFDDHHMQGLLAGFKMADDLLEMTTRSLEPLLTEADRVELARRILALRDEYRAHSRQLAESHHALVRAKTADPLTGVFFSRFVRSNDRIVRHAGAIAQLELQPVFFVKHHKLDRPA
jgi:phosphate:Na+ symporter